METAPKQAGRIFAFGFAAALAALLLFAWLSGEVVEGETLAFDRWARTELHQFASPVLTAVMRFFTALGSVLLLVILTLGGAAVMKAMGMKRAATLFLITMAGAAALNLSLKLTFQRARPEAFFGTALPSSPSFPSGHALLSVCLFGFAAEVASRRARTRAARVLIWTVAALVCLLIGLSRIYLGVHYPTDVIAGYAAAVVWVGAVSSAYHLLARRRPQRETGRVTA